MIMDQIIFNFGSKLNYQEEDFIISQSNAECYNYLKQWPHWGSGRFSGIVYLEGTPFSGKTHLVNIWMNLSYARILHLNDSFSNDFLDIMNSRSAFVIDPIDDFIEHQEKLLNIINLCVEKRKYLLLTSNYAPQNLPISIQDLRSRLLALYHIKIDMIEIEDMKNIIFKYFLDRQLKVSIDVINYIVSRIERSYKAINEVVTKIDQLSLTTKRNITIPLLKEIL